MKDHDRLNLLKEVAGTTVYEERRQESLKIMQETSNKQEQITVSKHTRNTEHSPEFTETTST